MPLNCIKETEEEERWKRVSGKKRVVNGNKKCVNSYFQIATILDYTFNKEFNF
jgi:hypothetical protein